VTLPAEPPDARAELEFWRASAETRGNVIRSLHEFNYWHESTVARGEVIAGLEQSVALWRERCLAAEARLAAPPANSPRRDFTDIARRTIRRLGREMISPIRRFRHGAGH